MTDFSAAASDQEAGSLSNILLRNIKGIIFDFDGTLFDNALIPFYLIAHWLPDMFRLRNERLIRRQFAGCDYSSSEAYYSAFFEALGKACRKSPSRVRAWYFNRFIPRLINVVKRHYRARPGVIELFRCFDPDRISKSTAYQAYNRPKIAVYSDYPCLKERLEVLGIYSGPGILLYGPETFGAQKPAPRPFLSIAKDLKTAPGEILVIGDREETDGLGAYRAGMRFFCLETGHKRYFRLDPNRRPADEEPHGPSLLMHAGAWEDLNRLLMEKYS